MTEINYFTCTLGQAAAYELPRPFTSIQDLIERKASQTPDLKAIGFPIPPKANSSQAWTLWALTFEEVKRLSQLCATIISRSIGDIAPRATVALLCSSTPEFVINWLALVQLSHPVLLIAPQCTPQAITDLCKECQSNVLFYDDAHATLAQQTRDVYGRDESLLLKTLPVTELSDLSSNMNDLDSAVSIDTKTSTPERSLGEEVAYFHHTSGTSSGSSKPIPQTHHAAVGVLPQLDGAGSATFTTTPLYHGGIADLFRAWTSEALILMFYGNSLSITAENVNYSLDVCRIHAEKGYIPPVRYFSSVPYVLQLMSESKGSIKHLQAMDAVGVGGAAMVPETGESLVAQGVNLLSRFGSTECGFLLSSHRRYESDKDWQYLRLGKEKQCLRFEAREDELCELIVLHQWPHLAKRNRDDGSYATSDLFRPHGTIPDAWKYHSRLDSQLTLMTGKKFDPAPLEAALAKSDVLAGVFVFGNGKPYPGALLFRAEHARDLSDKDVLEAVAQQVDAFNAVAASHARLARGMLVPMPFRPHSLERSSKGTIIRARVEQNYANEVEESYDKPIISNGEAVADCDVPQIIQMLVTSSSGTFADMDADLFSCGVDSIASIRLRRAILDLLPAEERKLVPLTIIEDCGNVSTMSRFVITKRAGVRWVSDRADPKTRMLALVDQYGTFEGYPVTETSLPWCGDQKTVVLTGATGALGAHVLHAYLHDKSVNKIYCLVRGANDEVAYGRVSNALRYRELLPLDSRVVIVRAKLSEPELGLSKELYERIAQEATIYAHCAWAVNFRLGLSSFVHDHISGLRHLLDLALRSPKARFIFCSSVASVSEWRLATTVPEKVISDPRSASTLGYSQSKWVAEQICVQAQAHTDLRGRIALVRVGQLSGDSNTGIWNEKEAWPQMLGSVKVTGSLPSLPGQILNWLPVDKAAAAFVEIGLNMSHDINSQQPPVYHLVNDRSDASWDDLIEWMSSKHSFRTVAAASWVDELVEAETKGKQSSSFRLLEFWKTVHGKASSEHNVAHEPRFETLNAKYASPTLRGIAAIDEAYFGKIWSWIDKHVN